MAEPDNCLRARTTSLRKTPRIKLSAKLQRTLIGDLLDNVSHHDGLLAKVATAVSDLKCALLAINLFIADTTDMQDVPENGYAVAGLGPPTDIRQVR